MGRKLQFDLKPTIVDSHKNQFSVFRHFEKKIDEAVVSMKFHSPILALVVRQDSIKNKGTYL